MSALPAPPLSFRLSLAPLLRPCFWFAGVLLVASLGVEVWAQYRMGVLPQGPALLQATVLPLALGAALAVIDVLIVLACPVRVLPEGLRAFNAWGVYRTVKWGDIPSVTPASLLGMRFLKVAVPASTLPLTVPLALRDKAGFLAAVEQLAGPTHLLAQALRGTAVSPSPPSPDATLDATLDASE